MSGICWHDTRPDWRHFRSCPGREGRLIRWGRCRSGKRWFWAIVSLRYDIEDLDQTYGWADTEDQAFADARAAVVTLADGAPAVADLTHGVATRTLKEVNAAKRKARPSSGDTDPGRTEYLYGVYHHVSDDARFPDTWKVVSFQITKRTSRRVYYIRSRGWGDEDPEIGYVNRQELEANGEVRNRGRDWFEADDHLYAEPPDLSHRQPPTPAEQEAELSRLRAEMADAHPDRGGTNDGFIAARRRYVQAKRKAATAKAS